MMGGGQNWGEIFNLFVTPRPRLDPRTLRMPSEHHPHQAMTVSYPWAQYIAPRICIWLITSSKTERACANRNARLLDFVRYGRVRVMDIKKQ